jgi:lambda repressor-like predicted transcriptional regulator
MKPEEIKAAIALAGTSQSALATHLGVTPQSVGRVISKTMRSARIERELEKITGKPIHDQRNKPGRPRAVWNGRLAGRPV